MFPQLLCTNRYLVMRCAVRCLFLQNRFHWRLRLKKDRSVDKCLRPDYLVAFILME